jgi:hypothetical protein
MKSKVSFANILNDVFDNEENMGPINKKVLFQNNTLLEKIAQKK